MNTPQIIRASSILTLLITLVSFDAQAQSCQRIEVATDSTRKHLLYQFIDECYRGRYFIEDKGIVSLTIYQNAEGQEIWSIHAMIDDRYKDNPPTTYSILGNNVILVYSADSLGRTNKVLPQNIASINRCIGDVIANRVYQRPLVKERSIEVLGTNKEFIKLPVKTITGGNYWNSKRVLFNTNGTYRILTGV
jgi:hypothetical protein